MAKNKKGFLNNLDDILKLNRKNIAFFFLGIGLIMFILNITTILNFIQYTNIEFPMQNYYTSVTSSLFLMGYSLYNVYCDWK